MAPALVLLLSAAVAAEEPPRCAGGAPPRRLAAVSHPGAGKAAASTAAGRVRAVVLFARFADEETGDEAPAWARPLFEVGRPGSLSHYYRVMSEGQFELTGQVLPRWFAARHPAAHYLADPANPGAYGLFGAFVADVLDAADRTVDFGRYDDDGPDGRPNSGDDDGFVDFLFVNTRSAPAGFIHGHATGIASLGLRAAYVTGDAAANGGPIRIRGDDHGDGIGGITQRGATWAEAVGTMAHEFGHALGLPDLFDLSFQSDGYDGEDDSAGIGYWGIMGHGNRGWQEGGIPVPFSAWSLEQLGWIGAENERLVVVDRRLEGAPLRDPRDGGSVYRIASRLDRVYYLVEFRSPAVSWYDRFLPRAGALVWQVDDRRAGNHDERRKLVDLICADGLYGDRAFPRGAVAAPFDGGDNLDFWAHDEAYREAHEGNLGDETDPFDGVVHREFSAVTNPASAFGVSLSLRGSGDRMLADLDPGDRRWAGALDGEVVWRDTVVLAADVTVGDRARLIIEPGTVILAGRDPLAAGLDPLRSELIVDGQLGCGSVHGPPVVFTSAADDPRPGDWFGLRLRHLARAHVENTRFEYAVTGLSAANASSPLTLARVRVESALADGIVASGLRTSLSLRQVEVTGSGGFGVAVTGSGDLQVEAGRFAANAGGGVSRSGGRLTVVDSDFADQPVHVQLEGASGAVRASRFAGGQVGLRVADSERFEVADSRFADLATGVLGESSALAIHGNTFVGVATVARLRGRADPSQLSRNAVEGARTLLANESAIPLRAAHNWWGPPEDGSVAPRMVGAVDWEPQLIADPRAGAAFGLQEGYPNPFNAGVTLDYAVGVEEVVAAGDGRIRLEAFDLAGQRVRLLADLPAASGPYRALWDGRGAAGQPLASGVYLIRLRVGDRAETRRVTLLR